MSTIAPPRPRTRERARTSRNRSQANAPIGRYTDPQGRAREVLCHPGVGGSVLVIDRLAVTFADKRLVAHLAADEPAENARIVCSLFLSDERSRCCRRLEPQDLQTAPPLAGETHAITEPNAAAQTDGAPLLDRHSYTYELESRPTGMSVPELRWWRIAPGNGDRPPQTISVRAAIGSLESYEPVRSITAQALATHARDQDVSIAVVRAQLRCLDASRIVLNRGLREAVLAAVQKQGLSMSEIAMRCGHFKYDARGNISGETSWLARRIGKLPEGAQSVPTPWIHSETLALIARRGLRIPPREVELG